MLELDFVVNLVSDVKDVKLAGIMLVVVLT